MKFAVAGCQHAHIKMFIDEMIGLGHHFAGIYDNSDFHLPELYAESYHVPLVRSMDKLFDLGIDIIGNAAKNDEKIDIIEWAESRGIHVMTDKPIVINETGLNRLQQVIDRGIIKIGMMLTERFDPTLYTLKQLIDQGELGNMVDITFLKPHKVNNACRPAWFFDKALNGGLIIDIMVHDVDLLRWLTGKRLVSYQGILSKNSLYEYPTFYDNAQINILLESQITATLKADWLMPDSFASWGDGRIFVTGTEGRAEIRSAGDIWGEPGCFITLTNREKARRLEVQHPPVSLSEDFLNQIQHKPFILTAEDIFECSATVLKMDAAAIKLNRSER